MGHAPDTDAGLHDSGEDSAAVLVDAGGFDSDHEGLGANNGEQEQLPALMDLVRCVKPWNYYYAKH